MAAAAPIAIGLQVATGLTQAKSQHDGLEYNAGIDQINAQRSLADGAAQENDINARARAVAGDALAATAANGVQVGTGSALDALRQTAINAQFNVLNARAQAQGRANAYELDATAKKAQAKSALINGILGAGAKALSGFGGSAGGDAASASAVPGGSTMPIPLTGGYNALAGSAMPESLYG